MLSPEIRTDKTCGLFLPVGVLYIRVATKLPRAYRGMMQGTLRGMLQGMFL